jgi:hypothetical protein
MHLQMQHLFAFYAQQDFSEIFQALTHLQIVILARQAHIATTDHQLAPRAIKEAMHLQMQ